eukprot:6056338-Prymnesium_polylepis.2
MMWASCVSRGVSRVARAHASCLSSCCGRGRTRPAARPATGRRPGARSSRCDRSCPNRLPPRSERTCQSYTRCPRSAGGSEAGHTGVWSPTCNLVCVQCSTSGTLRPDAVCASSEARLHAQHV